MAYTLRSGVDSQPIAIDGAGTLGRTIASVYAAGGTDVRLFDLSEEQLESARAEVVDDIDRVRRVLKPSSTRSS
jgi:3-hydroxybutyryl-CoA dehydrogenase